MFGDIIYTGGNYNEYLLSSSQGATIVACCQGDTIVMYRIEWREGNTPRNTARYSLPSAVECYRDKTRREVTP